MVEETVSLPDEPRSRRFGWPWIAVAGGVILVFFGVDSLVWLTTAAVVVVCFLDQTFRSRDAESLLPSKDLDPTTSRITAWLQSRAVVGHFRVFLTWIVVGSLTVTVYLADIGNNPAGLFCDEAEIGLESLRLVHDDLRHGQFPLFYNHFGYSYLGALPLYSTAPFVVVFGLSDVTVRLASALWMLAALLLVYLTLRRLRLGIPIVAAATLATAPITMHMGRVNFGHSPSLFAVAAGFYCWVRAKQTRSWKWAVAAGVAFGVSVYGYPGNYIATPIYLGGLVIAELLANRRDWRAFRTLAVIGATAIIVWLPVAHRALSDDSFGQRFRDKDSTDAPLVSSARVDAMASNYLKYFGYDYLFDVGEVELPGAFITRHSVKGAGLFHPLVLPLVIIGLVVLIRDRGRGPAAFAVPFAVVLLLYPLPDLVTTSSQVPPYTFAVFPMVLVAPFLAAAATTLIKSEVVGRALLVTVLIAGAHFTLTTYRDYPLVSADYWGWQYGPRQAISYFESHRNDYDEFLLDPNFNEAHVFVEFYLHDDADLRAKTRVGSLEQTDLGRRQLLAIRAEVFANPPASQQVAKSLARIVSTIFYPNGHPAFYLVTFDQRLRPEGWDRSVAFGGGKTQTAQPIG